MADKRLQQLIINKGTEAKFNALTEKSDEQLYFITDSNTYVATDQGVDNAGKILTVGSDGNLFPAKSEYSVGIQGDYCSKYGIVDETASGLPTQGTGNQIIIPAGLVLDVPGVSGLTTNASVITHDLTSTTDCEIFLAEGTVIEATEVYWQTAEPEDGQTGYLAWWNGTEWKFKSNDTGNVWRAANAVRIAKCVFTDGSLTRLCFTGCRVLNKQEWLPKSSITMPSGMGFEYNINVDSGGSYPLSRTYAIKANAKTAGLDFTVAAERTSLASVLVGKIGGQNTFGMSWLCYSDSSYLGTKSHPWSGVYAKTLNGGADNAAITVPTTGGTMVVATPPTTAGNYVLKATVADDETMTTQWGASENALRGVGDIFSTTDTGVIVGAVDANGGEYNIADYNSGTDSLAVKLASGKLSYVSKDEYNTTVTSTGYCGSFGWNGAGGDKLYAWERNYSYVYTKSLTLDMHAPVYNADGTIFGRTADAITEGDSELFVETKNGDSWTVGGSYTRYTDEDTTLAADTTFIVPKLPTAYITNDTAERVMVQLATGVTDEALETCTDVLSDISALKDGTNFSTTGKANISNLCIPDYSNGVTIDAFPFTAPSNGLIAGWWYGDSSSASINNSPIAMAIDQAIGAGSLQAPIGTGDVFTISATPTSHTLKFYPYKINV